MYAGSNEKKRIKSDANACNVRTSREGLLLVHAMSAVAIILSLYAEKLDPQPQLLVECGLIKLKPCRISVSSKSRIIPLR